MPTTRQSPTAIIRIKAAVRERDGYACVHCGKTNDDHIAETGRQLDVHRKQPGSLYSAAGCETVCRSCHGPLPGRAPGQPDLAYGDKSGFLIRLPEEFRPVLESLQTKNDRPMTIELQRAVIAYAKAEGVKCPDGPIFNGRRRD